MKKILFLPLAVLMVGCQGETSIASSIQSSSAHTESSVVSISEPSSVSDVSSDPTKILPQIKVYLNPSVQIHNMYYGNICSEAEAMNAVSHLIYQKLSKNQRFIVYQNDRMLSLSESVKESNALKVDYHLALHSNAGGGSGSESFFVSDSSFASAVLSGFNRCHSYPTRGIKEGSHLYELKNSTAKNKALIEFLFHDNESEATFIRNHYELLADSIVETFYRLADET